MKAPAALKWSLLAEESGQALAEYSLILAFIAAVCVLALTAPADAVCFSGARPR